MNSALSQHEVQVTILSRYTLKRKDGESLLCGVITEMRFFMFEPAIRFNISARALSALGWCLALLSINFACRPHISQQAIREAVERNDIATLKQLIAHRGAVDSADEKGLTPLMDASGYNHPDAAALLLDHGADVNARAHDGSTALMAASTSGATSIAQMLIAKGARVNDVDKYGHSALMVAALYRHQSVVLLLIENGADVSLRQGFTGETAIDVAARRGYTEIVELLEKALKVQKH